jgi:hypothetical protein
MRLTTAEEREMDAKLDTIDGPKLPVPILVGIVVVGLLIAFVVWATEARGASPEIQLPTAECDVLEISHYYDDNGKPLLTQLIAWSWSDATGRHEIREWKIVGGFRDYPRQTPDGWIAHWSQNRIARAKAFKESWWNFDIELIERQSTPREQRVPLFAERKPE